MPKGIPNQRYTSEFKEEVIRTMQEEKLGYRETAERFGLRHKRVQDWERIYLEEGPEGFRVERRGCRSRKLSKAIEEDLLAEVSV